MRNGLIISEYGIKYWYKNDKLHREDGPAVMSPDGSELWFKEGLLHRENGPAAIWPETAIIFKNTKKYYLNDIEYTEQEYLNKVKSL